MSPTAWNPLTEQILGDDLIVALEEAPGGGLTVSAFDGDANPVRTLARINQPAPVMLPAVWTAAVQTALRLYPNGVAAAAPKPS